MSRAAVHAGKKVDRQALILGAVLTLLSRRGISGVSMRAVAGEANVALGLVNYYFEDKTNLIAAALRRVEEQDIAIVEPDPALPPHERLRAALRRVADPEFLTTEYLSLRLQLWSLAQADDAFEHINTEAQRRYRAGLASLIRAARPTLSRAECDRRAADIDIVQNGLWLTALLGLDRASIRRSRRANRGDRARTLTVSLPAEQVCRPAGGRLSGAAVRNDRPNATAKAAPPRPRTGATPSRARA